MTHLLGMHWFRTHPNNPADFAHVRAMGYKSFTIYNNHYDNEQFGKDLLAAATPEAVFLLRDQPLSEEKAAFQSDPAGTGAAHAQSWAKKFRDGKIFLPPDRCVCLGINEPDSNQYQSQIDIYFDNFLSALASFGLRGGWGGFGEGHPSTVNLVSTAPVDWTWYKKSAATAKRLNGFAISHEYWMRGNYNWSNWCGRFQSCPYDLPWIIQEGFIDSGVIGKYPSLGWQEYYTIGDNAELHAAVDDLAYYHNRISSDPRVHSFQPFCYDENKDWKTFDIRPLAGIMENYPWSVQAPQPKPPEPLPTSGLGYPVQGKFERTQRFGEDPASYDARFSIPGHDGVDYAADKGTPVVAIADGQVQWIDFDHDYYGNYVRIFHPQYGFHSFYAHLDGYSSAIKVGDSVRKGAQIGNVGATGNATGPHLHLEIRLGYPDGSYAEGQAGYFKGRVDPETVYSVINYQKEQK